MKIMEWQLEDSGSVIGPPIHDGYITGVNYLEPDYLDITIIRDDIKFILRLESIYELALSITRSPQCDAVYMWNVNQSPEVNINISDNVWKVLYPYEDIVGASARRRRVVNENPSAILVNISCSFGGDTSVVCQSMNFYKM